MEAKIVHCSGCGIEITWSATINNGRLFCCDDCSQGIPCACADSVELDTDLSNPQNLSIVNGLP
jgi:hypothetical protein